MEQPTESFASEGKPDAEEAWSEGTAPTDDEFEFEASDDDLLVEASSQKKPEAEQAWCEVTDPSVDKFEFEPSYYYSLVEASINHCAVRSCRIEDDDIEIIVEMLGGQRLTTIRAPISYTVAEIKEEIASSSLIPATRQQLCFGGEVLSEDCDMTELHEDGTAYLTITHVELGWTKCGKSGSISDDQLHARHQDGLAFTQCAAFTAGEPLHQGHHFWEVELVGETVEHAALGVAKPGLGYDQNWMSSEGGHYINPKSGDVFGEKYRLSTEDGNCKPGDRIGVELDLAEGEGTLQFSKNGQPCGPLLPVIGPVLPVAYLYESVTSLRLCI